MNTIKIILIIIISALIFNANAQQDTKAKSILDKVSANNKAYKTIEAEFVFKRENLKDKTNNKSKGKVIIKGNKYKLDLMGTESYFDGKTLYSLIKDANEVNITEPDPSEEGTLNPAKLFTIYEKGFKYKYISEKFENSKALYEIELYPTDVKKEYAKIILKIDKDKNQIFSFLQINNNGTNFGIELTKTNYNKDFNDATFVFDKKTYPKAMINDMR